MKPSSTLGPMLFALALALGFAVQAEAGRLPRGVRTVDGLRGAHIPHTFKRGTTQPPRNVEALKGFRTTHLIRDVSR